MKKCIKSPIEEIRNANCETYYTPTITDEQIIDISKASNSNYYCVFSKFPNLIYYIQSFALPSATNRKIQIDMPHTADYQIAGHKTDYDELSINFIMDENFLSYFSLIKWMRDNEKKTTFEETISRLSLIILNNAKAPIIRVDFRDVLCSSVGDLQFQNQSADVMTFYATFTTHKYKVTYLDGSGLVIA